MVSRLIESNGVMVLILLGVILIPNSALLFYGIWNKNWLMVLGSSVVVAFILLSSIVILFGGIL